MRLARGFLTVTLRRRNEAHMSFLDKIKGISKGRDHHDLDVDNPVPPLDDVVDLSTDGTASLSQEQLGRNGHADSSIITEAAPSEIADFSETRLPAMGVEEASAVSGLPVI